MWNQEAKNDAKISGDEWGRIDGICDIEYGGECGYGDAYSVGQTV